MIWTDYFSDWDFILSLFPKDWKEKFKEFKLLKFGRKFTGENKESDLLRVIFMHLACGISLRTTVAEAKAANIVDIVDVTLFKHFRKCEAFFAWCNKQLLEENARYAKSLFNDASHWKAVDGSLIRESGISGTYRRIHYSMNLPQLNADQVIISDIKKGESLSHFTIKANEVWLADRGFMRFKGIKHIVDHHADVVGRFSPSLLSLFSPGTNNPFQLFTKLRNLHYGEIGDFTVDIKSGNERISARVCAIKQTPENAKHEEARVREHARKNGQKVSARTLNFCNYLLVFTTLPAEKYSAKFILDSYQLRWQIELVFKRLKTLMELGQLHKYDDASVRSYLSGKMLIALLIEKMIRRAESFSP